MVHNFRTDASLPTTPQFFGDNGGRWGSGGVPTKFPAGFGDKGKRGERAEAAAMIRRLRETFGDKGGFDWAKFAPQNTGGAGLAYYFPPKVEGIKGLIGDSGGTPSFVPHRPMPKSTDELMAHLSRGRQFWGDNGGVHQLMNRVPYGGPPPFVMGDYGGWSGYDGGMFQAVKAPPPQAARWRRQRGREDIRKQRSVGDSGRRSFKKTGRLTLKDIASRLPSRDFHHCPKNSKYPCR